MEFPRRYFRFAFILPVLLAVGCVDAKTSYDHAGTNWDERSAERIKAGQTTRQWVVDTFGQPKECQSNEKGLEVLKYQYDETKHSKLKVYFILTFLDANESITTRRMLLVETRDGIVTRSWRDKKRIDKDSDLDVLH